jgi:hypothetical protein
MTWKIFSRWIKLRQIQNSSLVALYFRIYSLYNIQECDASRNGIGVVLIQEGRDFESLPLKGKDLHKPIYEKEMMEIIHALKKWHPYLISRHFKVKTDNDSLKYFLEQRLSSEEQ